MCFETTCSGELGSEPGGEDGLRHGVGKWATKGKDKLDGNNRFFRVHEFGEGESTAVYLPKIVCVFNSSLGLSLSFSYPLGHLSNAVLIIPIGSPVISLVHLHFVAGGFG